MVSSIHLARNHGIYRSSLHSSLINYFSIDWKYHSHLACYKLVETSGDEVKQLNKNGMINNSVTVFHKCTPTEAYKSERVLLSFREAKEEYELPAYVLVKVKT